MPRPGPRRQNKGIRMDAALIRDAEAWADREGLEWSDGVRTLIRYGLDHAPVGWRPSASTDEAGEKAP